MKLRKLLFGPGAVSSSRYFLLVPAAALVALALLWAAAIETFPTGRASTVGASSGAVAKGDEATAIDWAYLIAESIVSARFSR